jgi:hypothetical protein
VNAQLRRELAKLQREKAELEAKLAKPIDAAAKPAPPTEAVAAIATEAMGATDPLAIQDAAYRALAQTFFDAANDKDLSPRERRKELRTISAAMAKLFPESRRWKVDQLIRQDREPIDKRASAKGSPPLVTIP